MASRAPMPSPPQAPIVIGTRVLTVSEGQPVEVRTAMFLHCAILLEVVADMRAWPARVRASSRFGLALASARTGAIVEY
jgi:hypothetical protein